MVTPDSPIMPARHAGKGVAASRVPAGVVRFIGALVIPVGAIVVAMVLFGVFVAANGVDPLAVYASIYRGAFGTWFSWQNTLQQAAPLLLTALCTALPARLGLIVIGGEGALVMGAVAAVVAAVSLA